MRDERSCFNTFQTVTAVRKRMNHATAEETCIGRSQCPEQVPDRKTEAVREIDNERCIERESERDTDKGSG